VSGLDKTNVTSQFETGRSAGYAVLTRAFFHRPFVELVMVAPATRRQGIGLALVAHLVGVAPAKQNLWTSTNVSNAPMRELLAKAGFVQSGQIDNLDEGDPEVIFVRRPDGA
jgi:ribosomal protein S18 acetylase RimI-like enzyme